LIYEYEVHNSVQGIERFIALHSNYCS